MLGTTNGISGYTDQSDRGRLRHLEGYVILDLTGAMAGPFGTDILCTLGATVIKIEPKASTRQGPPIMTQDGLVVETPDPDAMGVRSMTKNYSKLSVLLNLKTPEGEEILHTLIQSADAFVHNFKPSTARSLKITAEEVMPLNPSIVYVSLDGLGPYATKDEEKLPVIDPSVEALAGTMIDPEPGGRPPRYGQFAIGDCAGGLYSAIAVLAGLLGRDGRAGLGRGSGLSISMLAALSAMAQETPYDAQVRYGVGSGAGGGRSPDIVGLSVLQAKDGRWVYLTAVTGDQRPRLGRATGIPEFRDPEYQKKDIAELRRDSERLNQLLDEWAAERSSDELLSELRAEGVSAWPIRTHADVVADERFRETFMYELEHPVYGPTSIAGVRFPIVSENPEDRLADRPPPLPGQDTRYVLEHYVGLAQDEIDKLNDSGVITVHQSSAPVT
jgi:CoA:oxalate CoA-transferase